MAEVLEARYELGRRLAVGGMAEVFEARDLRLDRRVAVKLLRDDVPDRRARERFEREARVAAAFDHPDAVTIFDVGEHDARPFLVMELIEGRDLAELLADTGALEPRRAVAIMDPVLRALAAAHDRGLVHRDVKPGNVLLGADGRVRLADFGIAKALADATSHLTGPGQVIGTPRYLAPEQVRGEPATPRSDVYAAGVVLFEMLAGSPPYPDDTVLALVGDGQPGDLAPSLATRRPDVAPALVAVVARALARDPSARFADAGALRRALAAGLADEAPASDDTQPWPVLPPSIAVPATGVMPAVARPTEAMPAAARPDAPSPHAAAAAPAVARPVPAAPPVERRRRVRSAATALAALVVLGGVGAVLAALARSDADQGASGSTGATRRVATSASTPVASAAAPPRTTTPTVTTTLAATTDTTTAASTTTRASTTTTHPPTTGAKPDSIARLIADLTANPTAAGSRGPALAARLRTIEAINPRKRAGRDLRQAVDTTTRDVRQWIDDGSLDAATGQRTLDLLRALGD